MDLDDEEDQVEIEYVTEDMELTNPYFRTFSQIFEKFKVFQWYIYITKQIPYLTCVFLQTKGMIYGLLLSDFSS